MPRFGQPKLLLFLVLLFAFAIRATVGMGLQYHLEQTLHRAYLIEGDAKGYWALGKQIAQGNEFEIGGRSVLRMSGFPALLAASMVVAGDNFWVARLLLAVVGTVACGLVYWLGLELFDERTGIIAAALTAVSPTMAGFSVLILSETLFAATLVGSLILLAKLIKADPRHTGFVLSLAAGGMIGLACYVRPSWLLIGPGFAVLYVLWSRNRKLAFVRSLGVLVGLLAILMPWTIRNYQVTNGRFVPTTLWVGPSLYDGLNPRANGDSNMSFIEQDNLMHARGYSEYEVDRHYRNQAWQFVREHPGRTVELMWEKLKRFWRPWPNAEQFRQWWMKISVAAFFVPMLVFAVIGGWRKDEGGRMKDEESLHGGRELSKFWRLVFTVGPIVYFTLIHLVFVGSLRYRLPAEYPLCVMSAVGLQSCWPNGWTKITRS